MDITISTDPKSEEKEKRPPICGVKMALQILDSSASEGANKCGNTCTLKHHVGGDWNL